MIDAYVEGRPMPFSSRARTKVASVYRAGACVLCPKASMSGNGNSSPSASSGSLAAVSPSASASSPPKP